MSASHVSHRFEVERVRRHIRWSQSTEIVCRADLDSFLIGAKTHRMVHRKMEDARRIPDEATGMNLPAIAPSDPTLTDPAYPVRPSCPSQQKVLTGICFDAHCADDSSADTTESNWTVSMGQMGGCFASGLCLCGPVHVSSSSRGYPSTSP